MLQYPDSIQASQYFYAQIILTFFHGVMLDVTQFAGRKCTLSAANDESKKTARCLVSASASSSSYRQRGPIDLLEIKASRFRL